jgi:hypothetical protein
MATDASILMGYRPPQLISFADAEQNALANRMNRAKLDEYDKGVAEKNALSAAYKQFGTDNAANIGTLYKSGFGQQAQALQKSQSEAAKDQAATNKTQIEAASKKLDLAGSAFGYVRANPSAENARAALDYLGQNGVYSPEQVAQYKQKVLSDPSKVGELADMAFRASLSAKDQLLKTETRNTGGATDTLAIDPVTGLARVSNSVKNTQSPDSIASNATAMRGQNMTDARARENTIVSMSKPFEVTGEDGKPVLVQQDKQGNIKPVQGYTGKGAGSKSLTDGQAKAVAFASRMENSNQIIDELAKAGREVSTPGSRAGYGIGSAINAIQPDKAQQLDQAKRDFINAVLRRESGAVISPSEFDNAENQYFPQFGEGESVKANKAKNRRIALEGMKADIPSSMGDATGDIIKRAGGATGTWGNAATTSASSQDAQAMQWAKANANDPRAKAIIQRLGGQ